MESGAVPSYTIKWSMVCPATRAASSSWSLVLPAGCSKLNRLNVYGRRISSSSNQGLNDRFDGVRNGRERPCGNLRPRFRSIPGTRQWMLSFVRMFFLIGLPAVKPIRHHVPEYARRPDRCNSRRTRRNQTGHRRRVSSPSRPSGLIAVQYGAVASPLRRHARGHRRRHIDHATVHRSARFNCVSELLPEHADAVPSPSISAAMLAYRSCEFAHGWPRGQVADEARAGLRQRRRVERQLATAANFSRDSRGT